jgi:ParB family chromosome partitioning protein
VLPDDTGSLTTEELDEVIVQTEAGATQTDDVSVTQPEEENAVQTEEESPAETEQDAAKKAQDDGNRIGYVKIDEIQIDLKYPRKGEHGVWPPLDSPYLEVGALANSIRQYGVLHPILVQRDKDAVLHLITGRRRVAAAKQAGKTEIPAIFLNPEIEINPQEISLVENIHRRDLTALEEAEVLCEMRKRLYSYRVLGPLTGRTKKSVLELLIVNQLSEDVKEYCRRIDCFRPIPRPTLLRIARMESSDSDKIDELEKFVQRTPRPDVEVTKDKAQSLNKRLRNMKQDVIEESEKEELDEELRGLKTSIDKVIS